MDSGFKQSLTTWLFGFFGAIFAFLLLPRTIKFFIKRFFFGIAGEVVAVLLAGLLTEKAVDRLRDDR